MVSYRGALGLLCNLIHSSRDTLREETNRYLTTDHLCLKCSLVTRLSVLQKVWGRGYPKDVHVSTNLTVC